MPVGAEVVVSIMVIGTLAVLFFFFVRAKLVRKQVAPAGTTAAGTSNGNGKQGATPGDSLEDPKFNLPRPRGAAAAAAAAAEDSGAEGTMRADSLELQSVKAV